MKSWQDRILRLQLAVLLGVFVCGGLAVAVFAGTDALRLAMWLVFCVAFATVNYWLVWFVLPERYRKRQARRRAQYCGRCDYDLTGNTTGVPGVRLGASLNGWCEVDSAPRIDVIPMQSGIYIGLWEIKFAVEARMHEHDAWR